MMAETPKASTLRCLLRLTLEVVDLEACEVLRVLVFISPAAGAALAGVVAVAQVQPELPVGIRGFGQSRRESLKHVCSGSGCVIGSVASKQIRTDDSKYRGTAGSGGCAQSLAVYVRDDRLEPVRKCALVHLEVAARVAVFRQPAVISTLDQNQSKEMLSVQSIPGLFVVKKRPKSGFGEFELCTRDECTRKEQREQRTG